MATVKQKRAFKKVAENGGNVSKAMVAVGYSPMTAKTPKKLTESEGWKKLMDEHMSDKDLAKKHRELLNSTRLDHMTFPLGPKEEEEEDVGADDDKDEDGITKEPAERTTLTDKQITEMLKEVNCVVRRIVHGQYARHVYFWAPDSMARDKALDKAYKLKGKYAPEKTVNLNLDISGEMRTRSKTAINQFLNGETN